MTQYNTTVNIGGRVCRAVYGYDNSLGYFIQILAHGAQEAIVEESSAGTRLTGSRMLELVELYGIELDDDKRIEIAFDLPF